MMIGDASAAAERGSAALVHTSASAAFTEEWGWDDSRACQVITILGLVLLLVCLVIVIVLIALVVCIDAMINVDLPFAVEAFSLISSIFLIFFILIHSMVSACLLLLVLLVSHGRCLRALARTSYHPRLLLLTCCFALGFA